MDLQQVETEFIGLIDEIERTGEAIIITRGGRSVARLEPVVAEPTESSLPR